MFKNKWVGPTNKTFNSCHLNEVLYDKKCVSLHDHFAKCVLFDFFPYLLRKKKHFSNNSISDEEVPGVLTSFPALNNYHASVHGISNAYKIHRSTPERGSTLRSPPSQDNTISMSKSPNHQMEEESSEQKRNVDGSEQKKVDNLQWKTVDSQEWKKVDSQEWKMVDSPELNTVDSTRWENVDSPEQRVDIPEEKNKDSSEQESEDSSTAGIESPEIEVPLISKEDLVTRKSPTYSSSLGSSNSYSTNKR